MPQTCDRPIVEECVQFLSKRLASGTATQSRLTALLYLADRRHILTYGHSLADDRFASKDGKPLGIGTDRIVAATLATEAPRENAEPVHLSEAIEKTLQDIVAGFGKLPDSELDAALRSLPEATEVGPFSYRRLGVHLEVADTVAFEDAMETSRGLRWCLERLASREAQVGGGTRLPFRDFQNQ